MEKLIGMARSNPGIQYARQETKYQSRLTRKFLDRRERERDANLSTLNEFQWQVWDGFLINNTCPRHRIDSSWILEREHPGKTILIFVMVIRCRKTDRRLFLIPLVGIFCMRQNGDGNLDGKVFYFPLRRI